MAEFAIAAGQALLQAAVAYGFSQLTASLAGDRRISGASLESLSVQISSYGRNLPYLAGNMRLAGNIIWAQNLKEVTSYQDQGGGKGGGGVTVENKAYFATLAIAICVGEIGEISRVWADSKQLTTADLSAAAGKYEIYTGSKTQDPSPIIEGYEGIGNVPAYKEVAYVVLEDFPLANFGNRIPNFTFEVQRPIRNDMPLENKIKAITLIPGSGEYVYSRTLTEKIEYIANDTGLSFKNGKNISVNMHNHEQKPNIELAIDQMEKALPNLEYVSVVVNWFATSKDPAQLHIVPKVEYNINDFDGNPQNEGGYTIPDDWSVAGIARDDAALVLKDSDGNLNYGGTPTDKSILEICKYLHSKGYKVMLYPMLLVDTLTELNGQEDNKPWRGRITPTSNADVIRFFSGYGGYNDFITHYANLSIGGDALKNYLESFVIGTEMVGMTTYSDSAGSYPAVTELKSLASTIKSAVGSDVKVTYAADWSEYHSDNGWYHLDPLWSDPNIDFIAIDAYFPLTPDLPQSQITEQKIYDYWQNGEGWSYFYNSDRSIQTNYTPNDGTSPYAWKNFAQWWKNPHTNPNSNNTAWTAKMKPLRFTELGFPSVDGAANQPNVFYDPASIESFFPRGSEGNIDYIAQRQALNASLDFLSDLNSETGNENLVAFPYVWTWDARPYPYWPGLREIWADGDLYYYGHWIQGKAGNATLDAILADIFHIIGLKSADYDVSVLENIIVEGFILKNEASARQAIEQLKLAYQFTIIEVDGILKAVKYGDDAVITIDNNDVIPLDTEPFETTRQDNTSLPYKIQVTALSRVRDYNQAAQLSVRQTVSANQLETIELPLVLSDQRMKQLADTTLYRLWAERDQIHLMLPTQYGFLTPTDVIILNNKRMRILSISQNKHLTLDIMAVSDDADLFDLSLVPASTDETIQEAFLISDTQIQYLDLPALPNRSDLSAYIAVNGVSQGWDGATLYNSHDDANFNILQSTTNDTVMGQVLNTLPAGTVYSFDRSTEILIALESGDLQSVTETAVLNGANSAVIGNEIIQFVNAELIGTHHYRLTTLLRGRLGTEHETHNHAVGDRFILLDNRLIKQIQSIDKIGITQFYKPMTFGQNIADIDSQSFTYQAKSLKPYSPVHICAERNIAGDLTINWIRRTRIGGAWLNNTDIALSETSEQYDIDIMNGGSVIRTLSSTTPTITYGAGQQITDFSVVQNAVTVNIYQIGTLGRGYAGNAIV